MTEPREGYKKSDALEHDQKDPLASFRQEFYNQEDRIYLDGNSLGLLSKRAEASLYQMLDSWKQYGIGGWSEGEHPWFYLSENLGEKMATLVGAKPEEVVVTGSTTTNLHQLVATFYKPEGTKTKILADSLTFPSDIYALKSQLVLKGFLPDDHLIQVNSPDGHVLKEADLIEAMTDEVALVVLPSVLYRSGQLLDMKRLTEAAHQRNILIGFDLCHSVGAVPHELGAWGVDFAFWCTYKHLNGGPGAVASLFVNQKHLGAAPGLAGWFSSDKNKQFDMDHELSAAPTAGAYQIGTPHVLSVAPLLGSLSLFNEVGMGPIREKSLKLTDFMMVLIDQELKHAGFTVRTPMEHSARGAHIYLEHPEAARICNALKAERIIPDFRAPNGIRLAPVALYNTFEEVWQTVQTLKKIMDQGLYKKYENTRGVIA